MSIGYRKRDYRADYYIRHAESDDEDDATAAERADAADDAVPDELYDAAAEIYAELREIPAAQGFPLLELCTLYDFAAFLNTFYRAPGS